LVKGRYPQQGYTHPEMKELLKREWDDVKGNVKWDALKEVRAYILGSGAASIVTGLWAKFIGQPLNVQLLSASTILLLAISIMLFIRLRRCNELKANTISQDTHPVNAPLSTTLPQPTPGDALTATATITPANLTLHSELRDTGIIVWLHNVDVNPHQDCVLILKQLSTYHIERKTFRNPTPNPIELLELDNVPQPAILPSIANQERGKTVFKRRRSLILPSPL
jgi:hypothetical protein